MDSVAIVAEHQQRTSDLQHEPAVAMLRAARPSGKGMSSMRVSAYDLVIAMGFHLLSGNPRGPGAAPARLAGALLAVAAAGR